MLGMELLEKEIEVVVGSPEIERFRELENELVEIGLLVGLSIGTERVGDQESEHHDIE